MIFKKIFCNINKTFSWFYFTRLSMLRKFTENNFIIRTKFISTCSSDFKTTYITKGAFIIDLSQSDIHENIIHQNWVSIRGMDNLFDDRLIGYFWNDNAFKLNKFFQRNDHFLSTLIYNYPSTFAAIYFIPSKCLFL